MAGGMYTTDPQTGLPVMQTPGGQPLYLPLSPDDMAQAGAQLAPPTGVGPIAPPAPGPDMRVAGPGGGPPGSGLFGIPGMNAGTSPIEPIKQAIGWHDPEKAGAAPGSPLAAQIAAESPPPPAGQAGPQPARIFPGQSRPVGAEQGAPAQGDGTDDPLVRQAMAEAMRGGGGGGPRGLGVTAQTRKYKVQGEIPDAVRQQANDAMGASDAYNEQLAMSLDKRQTQAYEAQQAEYQGRMQAVADQRALQAEQQKHLADFEAKWDAQNAETAQMKAPQMEDYWGSKSTMAKMATALSITLGGALQGLNGGGENPGLKMSNDAIDRWMVEQKDAYQRSKDTGDRMATQYGRMVQSYGSQNRAEQRLRDQAYGVRDAMMQSYAHRIGTPGALEAYNQAQLQSEAERSKMQEKAYADAGAEIEEKLSMQGGGGGGKPKGVLDMLRAGAEAKKLKDTIEGGTGPNPGRGIESGKTESLTAALNTIDAADEITSTLAEMGADDDDTDNPRAGAYDYVTKNIPGTNTRKLGQNLDQSTVALARGIQQTLGKSDNDAKLADQMANGGGGSGRERKAAALRAREKAVASAKIELSGLTPDQRSAFLQALPPDQRAKVQRTFNLDSAPAASEQVVR
jgi:hypothetical protein